MQKIAKRTRLNEAHVSYVFYKVLQTKNFLWYAYLKYLHHWFTGHRLQKQGGAFEIYGDGRMAAEDYAPKLPTKHFFPAFQRSKPFLDKTILCTIFLIIGQKQTFFDKISEANFFLIILLTPLPPRQISNGRSLIHGFKCSIYP